MYKEYNDAIKEINSILESLEDKASEIIDLVKSDLDGNEDILESIDEYLDYFSKEIDTYSIDDECILFRKINEYETWFRAFLDPLCEDTFLGESLKEKLIEKTQQLSYLNLYLMTLKWLLTKDESLLDDILFIIESEYTEGFIYPVDDTKYWMSEYGCINNLKVDKRIKQFIIYVDYFYKCYKDYVESYKEKEEYIPHIKVFNNNTIWETNYLEEKIYSLPEGKQYSRKEYYEITRTLTYEEKIETGKYAIIVIEDYIEVINIIKLIIKELSINDCDYSKLFKFTSTILENYSNLLYVNYCEYDFNSNVSSLECDTLRYINKRMAILYILLLKSIANKSIEEVLQSKCMLLPFANWNNPVVNEEFENAILKIVEHIENVLKNEEDLKIIRESVSKLIGEFGFEDNIVSSMINTLSTAEYLYNTYIIGGYEDTNFDYSFISILYYQAIENILNNLVFYPYKQYCISHKISKNNAELFFINPKLFPFWGCLNPLMVEAYSGFIMIK